MIIAITYDANTKTVHRHFGQTPYFFLMDLEKDTARVIDNGGYSHKELVPYLKQLGAEVLICGGIGTPAMTMLEENGIRVIPGVKGNVDEVIDAFISNQLEGNQNQVHECGCHH